MPPILWASADVKVAMPRMRFYIDSFLLNCSVKSFTLIGFPVEFTVIKLPLCVDEGVGVDTKSVHLSEAFRYAPVGEKYQRGVSCFLPQGEIVPKHVIIRPDVSLWISEKIVKGILNYCKNHRKTNQLFNIINRHL